MSSSPDHLQNPPDTYLVDPTFVKENLNYREMVALSGLFYGRDSGLLFKRDLAWHALSRLAARLSSP